MKQKYKLFLSTIIIFNYFNGMFLIANATENDKIEYLVNQEEVIEDIEINEGKEIASSNQGELRSNGSGLVQLWQVVPSGQESKEGKTTSEIMNALKCKANHDLLPSGGKSEHTTYVNSCYVDDALYLGEDSYYFYIYLAGYEGKVAKNKSHYFNLDLNGDGKIVSYEFQTVAYYIPGTSSGKTKANYINEETSQLDFVTDYLDKYNVNLEKSIEAYSEWSVQSPSYYASENGTLYHYLSNNVRSTSYSKAIVGKSPTWMTNGVRYYSYDGVYFYNDWREIDVDGIGAINQKTPFYNYYQFLPFRSVSNYSLSTINNYTASFGYTELPQNYPASSNESSLVNSGVYFYNVQNKYGINGALQYAMAIHESGWGRSSLSINKNNLFGMNATDNNPYGNGTSFSSIESGINYHADRYLSWGYTDALSDWRYYGSHVGNKGSGMNVNYASDPFWGEKIAGWYYRFDQKNGLKDYNYYSIGIKESLIVEDVKSEPNERSKSYYETKNGDSGKRISNYPVLLIGENDDYYRIKTDMPIENGSAKYSAKYNWLTTNAYILNDNIYVSNHQNYIYPYSESLSGWQLIDSNWYLFTNSGQMIMGWQLINNHWYYFNSQGIMQIEWQLINNHWYYFNSQGIMQTGWQLINNNWHYFNSQGTMQTGWQLIDNHWYYFEESGEMAVGWLKVDGLWYYLHPTGGWMLTGWLPQGDQWYYLYTNGAMATGWQLINNDWYYFYDFGVMATNTVIDGWQIDSNGIATLQ